MSAATADIAAYNFAYLDEQTKRMIRRAILKGIAIPGYQVPFASREMPMPYGWGTGGVQVTASIIGPDDVLLNLSVEFQDSLNAREVEDAVCALESRIRKQYPIIRRIFVEAESLRARRGRDNDGTAPAQGLPSQGLPAE